MGMEITENQKNVFVEEYRNLLQRHKAISEKSALPTLRMNFKRIAELQAVLDPEIRQKIEKEVKNNTEKKDA